MSLFYAGVYEYYREDNGEVVYVGITTKSLEEIDMFNREGDKEYKKGGLFWNNGYNNEYEKYNWNHIRVILRQNLRHKLKIRWIISRSNTTLGDLLLIQSKLIKQKSKEGGCYLNETISTYRKYCKHVKLMEYKKDYGNEYDKEFVL